MKTLYPTTNHQPPTTNHQPPTTNHQPLSLTLPKSSIGVRFFSFFALFLFSIGSLIAQTDCLPTDDFGCNSIETVFATIEHPDYPDCPIEVEYETRKCDGEQQIANVKVSFDYLGNTACAALLDDLIKNFFGGDPFSQQVFLINFWTGIETEIADLIWADVVNNNNPYQLDCFDGIVTNTMAFYRGACAAFCVGYDSEGEFFVRIGQCSTTCCKRARSYCFDAA